jgi:hypothetical protein
MKKKREMVNRFLINHLEVFLCSAKGVPKLFDRWREIEFLDATDKQVHALFMNGFHSRG